MAKAENLGYPVVVTAKHAAVQNPNPVPVPNPNPLTDLASTCFLHPGESPGLLLVSNTFTESHYIVWSYAMIVALDAKNKLGFMDDSLPQPEINSPFLELHEITTTRLFLFG